MKALVLGGGGAKGAFQVGVLKHLLCNLKKKYDIITGISVGAINGVFLSQYPHGKEKQAWNDLNHLWTEIKGNKSIYRHWYHGVLWKLPAFWKPSIYNSEPLRKLIYKNLDMGKLHNSGKVFRAGAVSYTSGVYKEWTERSADIHEGILASSAFPGFLTPPIINNELWTDGGVQNIVPLNTAVKLGATEIDIIATSPLLPSTLSDLKPGTLTIAKKTVDLMGDEIFREDLKLLELTNQMVKHGIAKDGKRFIKYNLYVPDKSLTEDPLDFDPEKLKHMKMVGYLTSWRNNAKK